MRPVRVLTLDGVPDDLLLECGLSPDASNVMGPARRKLNRDTLLNILNGTASPPAIRARRSSLLTAVRRLLEALLRRCRARVDLIQN
jgi:hypothetical protein